MVNVNACWNGASSKPMTPSVQAKTTPPSKHECRWSNSTAKSLLPDQGTTTPNQPPPFPPPYPTNGPVDEFTLGPAPPASNLTVADNLYSSDFFFPALYPTDCHATSTATPPTLSLSDNADHPARSYPSRSPQTERDGLRSRSQHPSTRDP